MVGEAGLEPARPEWTLEPESARGHRAGCAIPVRRKAPHANSHSQQETLVRRFLLEFFTSRA